MTNQQLHEILVYSHSATCTDPVLMGKLHVSMVRGKEIFSFAYEPAFLQSDMAFEVDPELKLYHGPQYPSGETRNFGIFLDSSPDRWGRVLMDRRETIKAQMEDRPVKPLLESDYLLGVNDESRMGAFRFKTDPKGPFLDNDPLYSTPPMTSLRELEHAVYELERGEPLDQRSYMKHLNVLIAPGSSLGGARPKASVLAQDGQLWIAKFPGSNDKVDHSAWEYLTYKLAVQCGIEMSESKSGSYYSDRTTFLTKRFDRDRESRRTHFFSAMTLLGYQDGDGAQSGISYLELAELLMTRGSQVDSDLEQLWRRIVFSICISNTDDHLRNHGFFLDRNGIRLTPAYDINPNPHGYGLHLNIDEHNNRLDPEIALGVAPHFRLSERKAETILQSICDIVKEWKRTAARLGINREEIERMAPAFLRFQ